MTTITMAKLSGTYDSNSAGLPRGRSSLSPKETREAQRRRIVRAAITAFAEQGYAATTVSDIVAGARVSRQVYYDLFETKEDCFLAAEELGREALFAGLADLQSSGRMEGDSWLRAPVRNYLRLCSEETHFARAWTIEFPNAGPRTLARRNALFMELGELLKTGHQLARTQNPAAWPAVPDGFYEAAIGGAFELVFRYISQHRYKEMPDLEETLVAFLLTCIKHQA